MPKKKSEVLIYGSVNEWSSALFIQQVEEIEGKELTVRVNTNGGDPQYMFGMAAKYKEFKGKKITKSDGKIYSSGLFFVCYADESVALSVSEFLVHRATYAEWIERDPDYFTEAMREQLTRINGYLRKAFESKVDVKKFEKMKGVTLDEIFSLDARIDVLITAEEALEIGLVDRLIDLTSDVEAEINSCYEIAASYGNPLHNKQKEVQQKQKPKVMTLDEFKAAHPDLFATVVALGVDKEKDRVSAWLTYNDVDAKAVSEGIESGKDLTQKAMADFSKKMFANQSKTALEAESAEKLETEKDKQTPEQIAEAKGEGKGEGKAEANKELLDLEAQLDKELGINAEKK